MSDIQKTLSAAAEFVRRHPDDTRVARTFVYFTAHPVAPLNHQRLQALVRKTEDLGRELGRAPRILDLACGGGLIANALAHAGAQVCGMDLDPAEITLAQEFNRDLIDRVTFAAVDLLEGPDWEQAAERNLGGKPDAVVMAYALHHLPQVEFFLDRLSRWVPVGTRLWVNEENPHSPLFQLKHWVRTWLQKDTEVEWHRTFRGWSNLLERRNWKVTRPTGYDPIPGWGRLFPSLSWSLVFQAERRS